jgi:hypothetical protein
MISKMLPVGALACVLGMLTCGCGSAQYLLDPSIKEQEQAVEPIHSKTCEALVARGGFDSFVPWDRQVILRADISRQFDGKVSQWDVSDAQVNRAKAVLMAELIGRCLGDKRYADLLGKLEQYWVQFAAIENREGKKIIANFFWVSPGQDTVADRLNLELWQKELLLNYTGGNEYWKAWVDPENDKCDIQLAPSR